MVGFPGLIFALLSLFGELSCVFADSYRFFLVFIDAHNTHYAHLVIVVAVAVAVAVVVVAVFCVRPPSTLFAVANLIVKW